MYKILILLVTGLCIFVSPLWGAWPVKPVKVIVPFKAGGTSDQTARVFQAAIKEKELLLKGFSIAKVIQFFKKILHNTSGANEIIFV